MDKLGLSPEELRIFAVLVGKRFNSGRREVRLITEKFTNRIENKRYLTFQLEQLIAEAKTLYANRDEINKREVQGPLTMAKFKAESAKKTYTNSTN